jgi:hypothetical protein
MFCPRCGINQSDEVKFCKSCGANLFAVRQVVDAPETGRKFDWSKTWVADMFLSQGERKRQKEELERQRGITPEVKRVTEIKAGVITASVGIGVMILLKVLMTGIILGGHVPPDAVEILSRIWVAGVIPICVGAALVVNGVFVSRKLVALAKEAPRLEPGILPTDTNPRFLRPADTNEFIPSNFSVTDQTTKHLGAVPIARKTP